MSQPTHEYIVERVHRLVQLQEQIDTLTAEANAIKGFLRLNLGRVKDMDAGGVKLSITPMRRFQLELARKLPDEWQEQITRRVIDPDTARRVLPPELYDACCAEGTLAVRVK